MSLKKLKTLGVIMAFVICFPLHFLYDKAPNFITSIISPVNESIFEHMKIIFGSILISGLSQELSAEFSRCDENYVAKVLKQPLEHRMLVPNRPNPEIEKRSKEMITEYLIDFVNLIKRHILLN